MTFVTRLWTAATFLSKQQGTLAARLGESGSFVKGVADPDEIERGGTGRVRNGIKLVTGADCALKNSRLSPTSCNRLSNVSEKVMDVLKRSENIIQS